MPSPSTPSDPSRQSRHPIRPALIVVLALTLLGASWWLIADIAGPDALMPRAWADALHVPALESPPYVGQELSFNDGAHRPPNSPQSMWVQYKSTKVNERTGRLVLHIENRSPSTGNLVFYLTRRPMPLSPGERITLEGSGELQTTDKRAEARLGFHAFDDQNHYVTEISDDRGKLVSGVEGKQALEQSHVRPQAANPHPRTITQLSPRLAVYNLAPGAKVDLTLDWSPPNISPLTKASTIQVTPWGASLSARPGKPWRFDVFGLGDANAPSPLTASIELRRGATLAFVSPARSAPSWATSGQVRDAWRLQLPASLSEGSYEARLTLHKGGRPHISQVLGQVDVSEKAGIWIGQNFHRYPGSSERSIGPLTLKPQFVRSFASDGWNPNEWWQGIDRYGWKGVDAWAQFHAPNGEKRLLLTFSGTPVWASTAPDQPSSMGWPGYAAPPRKELYPAYGRMVQATVARLKGRVMGVECWNEPDLAEFFTGSSTELADLCLLVRDHAKAVDPSISVICPQTTSARNLSLVMAAKTSDGRKLTDLCDFIGAHVYGAVGDDADGKPYDAFSLAQVVRDIQTTAARFGVNKPVAITEYGLSGCGSHPSEAHPQPFAAMSSADAGEALYQSLATLQASGVAMVAIYSYDEGNNDPGCRPGGSRARLLRLNSMGQQRPDPLVVDKFNQAVRDFGAQ